MSDKLLRIILCICGIIFIGWAIFFTEYLAPRTTLDSTLASIQLGVGVVLIAIATLWGGSDEQRD